MRVGIFFYEGPLCPHKKNVDMVWEENGEMKKGKERGRKETKNEDNEEMARRKRQDIAKTCGRRKREGVSIPSTGAKRPREGLWRSSGTSCRQPHV